MTVKLTITALGAWILAAAPVWADPTFGYWLTENRKAIIQVNACGGKVCGQMVWVKDSTDDTGAPKLDRKNEDITKRERPICGIQLFGDLSRTQTGWEDGWLYNPRDGDTYSVEIAAVGTDELKVHGYLGLPLLGKSQIWTRVDGDRGGC
jgi:uncharacterized protein (DUF2147 family)